MADLRDQPPVPEEDRPELPDRLSQTFLKHFTRCRRSGLLYLKHAGGPGSHAMDRGTAFHRFVERCVAEMVERDEAQIPADVAREVLAEVMADVDLQIAPEETDFLRVCAHHWAEFTVIDPAEIVGVERKVILELGDWIISGKIDLAWVAGERAGVRDWKTSPNLPDQAGWGPATTDDGKARVRRFQFQVLLYALLLAYGRPVVKVPCPECGGAKLVLYPGAHGPGPDGTDTCETCQGRGSVEEVEDTPLAPRAQEFELAEVYPAYVHEDQDGTKRLAERSTTISKAELDDHRQWLEGVLGKVDHANATGEWPALPGSHCSECPARAECPLPEHLRGPRPVESMAEAEAEYALYLRIEDEQKERLERIKAFATDGTEIVVGDKAVGYRYRQTRSVRRKGGRSDWDGLVDAIRDAQETGEPFDVEFWIKSSDQTRLERRTLKPEEIRAERALPVGDVEAERDERFGAEAPF